MLDLDKKRFGSEMALDLPLTLLQSRGKTSADHACGLLVVFMFPIEIPAATAQLGPEIDRVPPTIEIAYCSEPIVEPGIITVRGRSSDQESGISKVEGFSHTYPFDNQFPFKLAVPANPGDWSEWSMPLEIFDTRTRALIRATDNSGNENWDEIFIDINETQNKLSAAAADKSVAFVDPSFIAAAYNVDGFYSFYAKYRNVQDRLAILASKTPIRFQRRELAITLDEEMNFEYLIQQLAMSRSHKG